MRSRSSANAALVGDGSSGRSRRAFAERVAYSARLAFSSSSVCSRTRSAATERERESLASPRVCVAIWRLRLTDALYSARSLVYPSAEPGEVLKWGVHFSSVWAEL